MSSLVHVIGETSSHLKKPLQSSGSLLLSQCVVLLSAGTKAPTQYQADELTKINNKIYRNISFKNAWKITVKQTKKLQFARTTNHKFRKQMAMYSKPYWYSSGIHDKIFFSIAIVTKV